MQAHIPSQQVSKPTADDTVDLNQIDQSGRLDLDDDSIIKESDEYASSVEDYGPTLKHNEYTDGMDEIKLIKSEVLTPTGREKNLGNIEKLPVLHIKLDEDSQTKVKANLEFDGLVNEVSDEKNTDVQEVENQDQQRVIKRRNSSPEAKIMDLQNQQKTDEKMGDLQDINNDSMVGDLNELIKDLNTG